MSAKKNINLGVTDHAVNRATERFRIPLKDAAGWLLRKVASAKKIDGWTKGDLYINKGVCIIVADQKVVTVFHPTDDRVRRLI